MAVQVSYPGVYIEEFAPGAPIQGVSTSIAALIGLAVQGELDTPTKITSWDLFKQEFGDAPAPGSYLWHAVRGFFDNGGQTCYIVRASNGTYAEVILQNRAGNDLVTVRARQPGASATNLVSVEITTTSLIPAGTPVYQPDGTATGLTGRTITLTDESEAAQFRPGDWIDLDNKRALVVRVSKETLQIDRELPGAVAGPVRLADLAQGDRTLRIAPATALPTGTLVAGTVLTITQGSTSDTQLVETVQAEYLQTPAGSTTTTYRITLRQGLDFGIDMQNAATVASEEIDFTVTSGGTPRIYSGLGLDPVHPKYFVTYVNDNSQAVRLEPVQPPPVDALPQSLPADTGGPASLTGGTDEDLSTLTDQDYIDAVDPLRMVDEVSIVAAPGVVSVPVQQALIAHCELLADRFAVLDAPAAAALFGTGSVEERRKSLDSTRGYAALYYPWLRVISAQIGKEIQVPPSGHMIGILARVDVTRGVHKAPANEVVNGAFGVVQTMSDQEQGLLNLTGINVIRVFQTGGRPMLWGARTTATDLNWVYVNIRRLFLYLEESIQEGIRWAVFEPNNLQLWQKLKRTITEFLTRVWRDGALFGATAKDAFYVRIDEALNPFSEQALGRLNIEIGVRPTYPAEFIIVRIGIWPGGSEVSEG
jgi:phage tail sheath protein FI